jgi:DNA transformation protein
VLLNYFRVDDGLWQDRGHYSSFLFALEAARRERYQRYQRNRLKDLPNLTFQIEVLLLKSGSPTKKCYGSWGKSELAENQGAKQTTRD